MQKNHKSVLTPRIVIRILMALLMVQKLICMEQTLISTILMMTG